MKSIFDHRCRRTPSCLSVACLPCRLPRNALSYVNFQPHAKSCGCAGLNKRAKPQYHLGAGFRVSSIQTPRPSRHGPQNGAASRPAIELSPQTTHRLSGLRKRTGGSRSAQNAPATSAGSRWLDLGKRTERVDFPDAWSRRQPRKCSTGEVWACIFVRSMRKISVSPQGVFRL